MFSLKPIGVYYFVLCLCVCVCVRVAGDYLQYLFLLIQILTEQTTFILKSHQAPVFLSTSSLNTGRKVKLVHRHSPECGTTLILLENTKSFLDLSGLIVQGQV